MALTESRRLSMKTDNSVFKRLGRRNQENIARNHQLKSLVCKYWLEGRCTRNPCKFLHPKPATLKSAHVWKNPNINKPKSNGKILVKNKDNCDHNQIVLKTEQKTLASQVNTDQTENGEKCQNLHSWFTDKRLSMVAQLKGHSKDVTGVVLPSGSHHLYCGSKDKSLRVWDCNSGQCVDVTNFDQECGTLVEESPWIFAGLRDMIKAWNRETQNAIVIRASGGMVNTITMFEDVLFAGMEDGTILSWKSSTCKTRFSEDATSLKGHTGSVLSLIIGAKRLFSGSTDCTIRVWDIESLECKQVLNGHSGDVTSVICWDQYLFSGSLDKTIKVWGATESGNIEEVYRHDVDDGVVAFCGMHAEEKPILLCSCKDAGVCLYDLPSFGVKGRIFSEDDVKAIQVGPEGLLFTGDAAGLVSVWKLG